MALARQADTIINTFVAPDGSIIYAGVRVQAFVGGAEKQLYADETGTPTSLVETDANGLYQFWIEEGRYDLVFSVGGVPLGGDSYNIITPVGRTEMDGVVTRAETAADEAEAAAQNALNYGNAAIRSGYVAADAETWTAGAWVQITSNDTGAHASKAGDFGASGGQTPNSGVYQEDASLGLVRKAELESSLSAQSADDALAAAGFDTRAAALTFAPKMATGDATTVRETDTGTHAAVAGEVRLDGTAATVGELIPNEGRYTKQASGALWRAGSSERQLAQAAASEARSLVAAVTDTNPFFVKVNGPKIPIITDLVGNIIAYSQGGYIYDARDPSDPSINAIVVAELTKYNLQNTYAFVGSSGALVTDLVGNILSTVSALTSPPATSRRRTVSRPLKAADVIALQTLRGVTGTAIAGQSLSVGEHANGVISAGQPYLNVTFGGGPSSSKPGSIGMNSAPGTTTTIPLVETFYRAEDGLNPSGGETPSSGTCNYAVERALKSGLLSSAAQYVSFAFAPGHTGWSVDELADDAWFQLFRDQVDAIVAYAATNSLTVSIPTIFWIQGNADVSAGTSREAYKTKLRAYRAKCEAYIVSKIPDNGPLIMPMVQTEYGLSTTSAIALAQVDLCQQEPHFYMTGPTYHLPHVGTESHLPALGYKWLGGYWGRAKEQIEVERIRPDWLELLSVRYVGGKAIFKFRVPVEPVVIDESLCGPTTQSGLAILDGTGLVPLTNIVVSAADEITATCSRVPAAGATGRIGLDYKGLNIALGNARTANVRDSSDETCPIGGAPYPLYNLAVGQEVPLLFIQG